MTQRATAVALRTYAAHDFPLLERLLGDPRMMEYLGGPESPERLRDRHERYLAIADGGCLVVEAGPAATPVGWIGYWDLEWQGQRVWEMGWSVVVEYQGRGIATASIAACLARIGTGDDRRPVHAFPRTDNIASNRVCEKSGFRLIGEVDLEYPTGNPIRCNDWVIDLDAPHRR